MMKRFIFPYAAMLTFGLFMGACAEDEGNYDYTQINEVTIESIEANAVYEAGSHISITPTITILDEASANLSYSWTIGETEVSTERNLDIDLPPLEYGNQLCALTITDHNNGMQYRKTFTISINNAFNYGYYFLTRTDNGDTELAYIQSKEDDNATLDDVKYATGIENYSFGKDPVQLFGTYAIRSDGSNIAEWTYYFLTHDADHPGIVTNTTTFTPLYVLNNGSFVDQAGGYEFNPECAFTGQGHKSTYFISNGQFILYTNGKLYRPAQHLQDYYWSHPAAGASMATFAWVFDELSKKVYTIQAYSAGDEILGVIPNANAWDKVVEPEDNPVIEEPVITITDTYGGTHKGNVFCAAPDGLHIYSFTKTWQKEDPAFVAKNEYPLPNGLDENTAYALGSTGSANYYLFYNSGNDIYKNYTFNIGAPILVSDKLSALGLGNVEKIAVSAMGKRLIVVLYDESSPEERKGSVVFLDINTGEVTHTFPHILHHCVTAFGGNDSTSAFGYGIFGDGM